MINLKELDGGGDKALKEMLEASAIIGIDLVELIWIPKNNMPYYDVIQVIGYQYPIMQSNINVLEDNPEVSNWIDGTLKFYPDHNGCCWGYVFDTPYNRDLLASSLVNGWFKIVDKSYREKIIELAIKNEWPIEPAPMTEILIKKSKRERDAEEHVKNLEKEIQKYKDRLDSLLKAQTENNEIIEKVEKKKLSGIKIQNREELIEELRK